MRFCPQCGEGGADEQRFCMKCGAGMSAASSAIAAPPQPDSTKKTILIVTLSVLVVLAIPVVLIVAAVAIPNLLRARASANEGAAVASVRTLDVALTAYMASYGHYPEAMAELGPPGPGESIGEQHAALIDVVLAGRVKNGYTYTYEPVPDRGPNGSTGFTIQADPIQQGSTGTHHFFSDQTGIIRVNPRQEADSNSPPLE